MPKVILCVDDDPRVHEIVAASLRSLSVQVVGATDPLEAVATARDLQPDLIVLDLLMPERNGWETLDALRAQPGLADTPVLILTAKGSAYDRLVGENVARVSAYLSKPFRMAEFRECVSRLLWP